MNKHLGKKWLSGVLPQGAFACVGNCGSSHWVLLNPMGPIGASEKHLIFLALALMLIVVVPVIVLTFAFARKYRASNQAATYAPKWDHSGKIEAVVWLVPALIVSALIVLVWRYTHSLNPYKPIASEAKPIRVEVVALDWKWLFIYPDQDIATVNRLVIPAGVPVSFRITSDTVMSSFFIPQLGSQIFAMAGMQTRLHLVAAKPGTYQGLNSQFSGVGFSDQTFKTVATSMRGFDDWVGHVKRTATALDVAKFKKLEAPTENNPVQLFAGVRPNLFHDIMSKYMPNMAPPKTAAQDGGNKRKT